MAERTLTEPFESQGRFWLPDHPDKDVPGKLTFQPGNKIVVELLGRLEEPEPGPLQTSTYPVVMGMLWNGEMLTLVDTFESSHRWGAGGD